MPTPADLAMTLVAIEACDPSAPHNAGEGNYAHRNACVYLALHEATALGMPCGIALDPKEPDWPVAYIELPTGQISWHLPAHPTAWDGHDGTKKTERITAWIATVDDDPAYCCAMGNCLNCRPDPGDGDLTIGQALEQGDGIDGFFEEDDNQMPWAADVIQPTTDQEPTP